jgi:hypothetical protein
MKIIELTEDAYSRLHSHSLSFDDSPEAVIVRLLDEAERDDDDCAAPASVPPSPGPQPSGSALRAAPGSLVPLSEYWIPILRYLDEQEGSAHSNDVLEAIGEEMSTVLTDKDRQPLRSGAIRWRNRARFARLRMKERGLLRSSSHRGVWEITDDGRQFLAESKET